jgi:3-hydroxyacyl-[acyl-carrier-protein] dehydratase
MPPPLLMDLAQFDLNHVVVDQEGIRQFNPHRFEMEMLTAIVYMDSVNHRAVAYKDVAADEFWVRGHMPGFPLFPGVLMCEVAAQLASYHCLRHDLIGGDFIGFGGVENVQFRGMVRPGDRLVIAACATEIRRNRRAVFAFQEFVGATMVCHGELIGVPMHRTPRTGEMADQAAAP